MSKKNNLGRSENVSTELLSKVTGDQVDNLQVALDRQKAEIQAQKAEMIAEIASYEQKLVSLQAKLDHLATERQNLLDAIRSADNAAP